MGIAIVALTEKGQVKLIEWTKQVRGATFAQLLPGSSWNAEFLTRRCVVDLDIMHRPSAADHRRRGWLVVEDDRLEQHG